MTLVHSEHMTQPSRSALFNFQHKAAALGPPVKVIVRDPLGPEDASGFSEASVVYHVSILDIVV